MAYINFLNSSQPVDPNSGYGTLFTNSTDGLIYFIDDSGTVYNLTETPSTSDFGDLQDVTFTSLAQGDIVYYDGTDWVNLPAGTSGNILQTNGTGANPTWVTPASIEDVVWGDITGTLSNQTDLQSAIDAKADLDGATITNASVNGVTLTDSGSASQYLTGAGTYVSNPTLYTSDQTISGGVDRRVFWTGGGSYHFHAYDNSTSDWTESGRVAAEPEYSAILYLVGDGSGGVTSTSEVQVNSSGITLDVVGTDVLTATSTGLTQGADYSSSYVDRSIPDVAYVDSHAIGSDTSSTAQAPSGTEDGYALVWDNGNSQFTLADVSAGATTWGAIIGTLSDQTDLNTALTTQILGESTSSTAQAPTATEDGYVMTWDNANTQYTLVEQTANVSATLEWRFDTTTTEADPGNRNFRMDNATPASVTELYVNDTSVGGADGGNFLTGLNVGDQIYIQETNDAANFILAQVSATPTDNTGWWTIPVTISDSGTLFSNNNICTWLFIYSTGATQTTLYNGNGTLDSDRTVTANNSTSLQFDSYDVTLSDFTERSSISITDTLASLLYATGDGAGNDTAFAFINMNSSGVTVFDSVSSNGMQYAADYSGTQSAGDRWITDKGYADAHIASYDIGFSAGSATDGYSIVWDDNDSNWALSERTDNNIYNSDGTITEDRTIDIEDNTETEVASPAEHEEDSCPLEHFDKPRAWAHVPLTAPHVVHTLPPLGVGTQLQGSLHRTGSEITALLVPPRFGPSGRRPP